MEGQIELGDWVKDRDGLPFAGRVIGEGTLGKNRPAWKLDVGGGRISAILQSNAILWAKGQ